MSLGSFFKFTGNDPVFVTEFKDNGVDEAVEWDEIGVIFDLIGDTSTPGPWTSGGVSTDQQAIVRNSSVAMTGQKGTWSFTGSSGGSQYSWEPSEWGKKLEEGSEEGGIDAIDADLTFLGYHYQETFKCKSHDQCPFNPLSQLEDGFCFKDQSCKLCHYCVEDADAYGGTCPDKCPAKCSGTIPKDTCPDCGTEKSFIPPLIPSLSISQEINPATR